MMDFNELYVFGEAFKRGALRVAFHDHPALGDWISVLRADSDPTPPLSVRQLTGKRPYDLVGSTILLDLVSPLFRRVLQEAKLTGWDCLQVDAGSFEALNGYELFRVLGRCGPLNNAKSERAILPPPKGGNAVSGWRGLYFDPASWDGSDIFAPTGTAQVFVTERAAQIIKKNKLSNITLEPLTTVERLML